MIRAGIILLALLLATDAAGQFYDSRSLGMGGAPLRDGRGTLRHANPAYRAVPDTSDPRAGWSLPLGWLQALGDFPRFDPDDAGFDVTHLLQWQLQPPGPLAIGRQGPLSEDASMAFEDGAFFLTAEDGVPSDGVHRARAISLGELASVLDLGQNYGVVTLGLNGFAHHAVDIDHTSSAAAAEDWRGWGVLQTGLALEASYARELRLGGAPDASGADWLDEFWDDEDARPRLYVGGAARRLVGLAMTHLDGFATTGPGGLDYDVAYTSARAHLDGGAALGWAFDVGAVLRWRAVEVGLAAADLGASLDWPDVRRERLFPSVADQAPAQEPLAEGIRHETDLPTRFLLNVRLRRPAATWVLDTGGIGNQREGHLGYETRRGDWFWRGGVGLDTRGQLQAGAGLGWRPAGWEVDLGLLTDSGNLDGSRAVALGLSVGWLR